MAGFHPDKHCTPANDDEYVVDDYGFGDNYDDDDDDDDAIFCIMIHDPVICYPGGEIYTNACVAEHEGGYNPNDCELYDERDVCTEEYDPVICGDADDIFDNDCFATVEGGYNPEIDCQPYLDYLEYDDNEVGKNDDADNGSYRHSGCTKDYNPGTCGYGDEKEFFNNKCYARRAGWDTDDSSICAFFMENEVTIESLDCLIEGGDPIYCQGEYFINECYASNAGYDVAQDCSDGIPKTTDDGDGYYIACPDIWEPLSCEGTIYSNSCYAELDGYTPLIDCFSVSDGDDDPDFCADDSSFRFNLTTSHKTRSCKWLARKSILRKRNVCRDVAGVNIACQHTCGECSKSCSDNEIFLFPLRPGKVRSCKWLSKKDDYKIRNVCEDIDGVIDECKETCGEC